MFSLRYERRSTMVTRNLPFAEWTEVLGLERLTGALLDHLTHRVLDGPSSSSEMWQYDGVHRRTLP